jgi:cellulose synthase/poly-beta-1,6-N-acetylglucosamine synthase-like glycosyltransferase
MCRADLSTSVVIATRGRHGALSRCLAGVALQVAPALEVVVVDNTEGDPATREVAGESRARYIVEPVRGVSRARNRGARAARGDVVAFVDDDAVPEPDWLSALLAEFGDPRVAAVCGRTLALDSRAGSDGSPADERLVFGGPLRVEVRRGAPDWFERANFGGLGQGQNLAFRRSVFERWHGFDERLGVGTSARGMEEHYALFSLLDRDWSIVYTPAARVRHPAPESASQARALQLREIRSASFHMALLLVEEPRYRARAARYALGALRGESRAWRAGFTPPATPLARRDVAAARTAGVISYLLTRLKQEGRRAVPRNFVSSVSER